MEITERNLGKFTQWLMERGRVEGTAKTYCANLRCCAGTPRGLTHRLVAGELSPNALRTNLAALRAWALFTGDTPLSKRLGDTRLPPARRIHTKQPLAMPVIRKFIRHLQTCTDLQDQENGDAMRQVLLIMAMRGFRSGDVLRLRRTEVTRALSTGKLIYEGKGRKRLEFSAEPIRLQLAALANVQNWERVRDLIAHSSDPKVASVKVWRTARRIAKQLGIEDMNPHRFRHTFATLYLERLEGDPNAIIKLQQFMGWESMATAARYVDKVSQDHLDKIGADLVSGLSGSPERRGTPRRRETRP